MVGARATMYFITIEYAKNVSSFSIDGRCPTIIHGCNLDWFSLFISIKIFNFPSQKQKRRRKKKRMARALRRFRFSHVRHQGSNVFHNLARHAKNVSSFSVDERCPTIIHKCNLDWFNLFISMKIFNFPSQKQRRRSGSFIFPYSITIFVGEQKLRPLHWA